MILYVNACVRAESRTDRLARALLNTLGAYTELKLEELPLEPLRRASLEKRTDLVERGFYSDPMFSYASQFAQADTIVISAPYWDGSFPALLKVYLENIYVTGLVSRYGPDGTPIGMCRATKLYYVTTAGGPYDDRYSFGYLRDLAQHCFGIPEVQCISAEMLDVDGYDSEQLLLACMKKHGLEPVAKEMERKEVPNA